jgi:peptidyl-prolyl cis-trans isomerase C
MASDDLFRQPLIWFVLIGLFLFIADSRIGDDRHEIVITDALRDRLATLWTTQTGLVATEAEVDSLVDNWVKEEVLYREALRLGLDEDDSIVRRRLVQKLGFIAESEPIPAPEIGELEAFYQQHIDDYTLPVRYSLQHLYFEAIGSAQQALTQIEQGVSSRDFGEPSMLNPSFAYRSALELNATFGADFAGQIADFPIGSWQGPVQSGFGFHLVFLNAIHLEQITPLDAIGQQVNEDYRRARQLEARDLYIENLLQQYIISVELQ